MLTAEEKLIYGKLYDIAEGNAARAGAKMAASKEVFLLDTELEPQKTDMALLKDVSRENAAYAYYVAMLRHLPDEAAIQYWTSPTMMQKENYIKLLFRSLNNSVECSVKGIDLYNLDVLGLGQSNIDGIKKKLTPLMNQLYKIYRRLPNSFKERLRKVFR